MFEMDMYEGDDEDGEGEREEDEKMSKTLCIYGSSLDSINF